MKKRLNIPAAALLILAAVLGLEVTWAYFTYQKYLENRFRPGYNEITVTEEYDPPEEITPGKETEFRKAVQVMNTGTVPCYVRVRLEYSDSDMKEYCTNILGEKSARAVEWENHVEDFTDGRWTCGEDGCYYYTEILEAGEETEMLLERVKVNVPQEDAGKLKNFEIYVYAESIQTMVNEPDGTGDETAREAVDYREAWGQFPGTDPERSKR